jgi:3-hydroxyacyl-CoA dehydrogenase
LAHLRPCSGRSFQIIDFIGLNTAYNVSASGDENAQAIGQYLKENFIDRGKHGVSTGDGFYTYAAAS